MAAQFHVRSKLPPRKSEVYFMTMVGDALAFKADSPEDPDQMTFADAKPKAKPAQAGTPADPEKGPDEV